MRPNAEILIAHTEAEVIDNAIEHFGKNQTPILTAATSEEALESWNFHSPQLVVMEEGIARKIISETYDNSYSIAITTKHNPDRAVELLNAGVDRYLVNPSMREIEAMARTLRRNNDLLGSMQKEETIAVGDLSVDLMRHNVKHGSEHIELTADQYNALLFLMQHEESIVTMEELREFSRNSNSTDSYSALVARIHKLRKRLGRDGEPSHIQTYRGEGYKFRSRLTPSQGRYKSA